MGVHFNQSMVVGFEFLLQHHVASKVFATAPTKRLQSLLSALAHYVDFLFPGISKNKDAFGALQRQRTQLLKTSAEFFTFSPLEGISLPKTPVLCLYARRDRILKIYDAEVNTTYENTIGSICPQARFQVLDDDHFLSLSITRGAALRSMISFFQSSPTSFFSS